MERTHTAAVDTDFILHIAEMDRSPERIAEILDRVLAALGLCAPDKRMRIDGPVGCAGQTPRSHLRKKD